MRRQACEATFLAAAVALARSVRLISAVTPTNAEPELERLRTSFARGEPQLPRWKLAARDTSRQIERLGELARATPHLAEPLRSLCVARLEELGLEIAMVACVGHVAFGRFAAERHPERSSTAEGLAARWARARVMPDEEERVASDASDRRSLLSQVRAAIGAHRAPFAVRAATGLTALAATGERTVYVAQGRLLSERTARRVTLHEVLGHVMPRVRAERVHPIFALGTAGGTDDQEGLALVYEERHGALDAARRVELARRHIASAVMCRGADFVEAVRHLRAGDARISVSEALSIAARVFRGSTGRFPGLGRERVYLPAFLRVRAHLDKDPRAEDVLASGQIAVSAASTLVQFAQFGKQATPWPPVSTATV